MSILEVMEIRTDKNNKGQEEQVYTLIFKTNANTSIAEELLEFQYVNWHLESECGCMFEVTSEELAEVFSKHEETEPYLEDIYADDFYRIEVSY